jgi:hypothetical protein
MFSCILLSLMVIFSPSAFAILDFLAEEGKEATELVAYSAALTDLILEIDPNSEAGEYSRDLSSRINTVQGELATVRGINQSTKSLLSGPDLSSKRVLDNVKSLTMYLRRLKTLLATLGALGTEGAIAVNTAETNRHLSEMQKNQQTQMLLLADSQLKQVERDIAERKKWNNFFAKERGVVKHNAYRKH